VELELSWNRPVHHRLGAPTRLDGLDFFCDFGWSEQFPDRRAQFRNGQSLAQFVREICPENKVPVLLLTDQDDAEEGPHETDSQFVYVVNLPRYRQSYGDAARSYLASGFGAGITQVAHLNQQLADAAPATVMAVIQSQLDLEHIAAWVKNEPQRSQQLKTLVTQSEPGRLPPSPADTIAALEALGDLNAEEVAAVARLFGPDADRERRLQLVRQITEDPSGRYLTGEVFTERATDRIQDARSAIESYQALLDNPETTETDMQMFLERKPNLWLLGLDYAAMRARKPGVSGAMDFLLQRYDGFHDLLELKSPHDPIVTAPDSGADEGVPPPHDYALSRSLAQALAQAHVYRDRLTRHPAAAHEFYGLPHTRDPRLIVVIGRAETLPEHRQRVLSELNKSLHRVEILPYDVLARRAEAVLRNVEQYLLTAVEESEHSASLD
jgi:hypothetical protein